MNFIGNTEDPSMYIIGGLAVFCLWLKLFYFLRMFQQTAAFVRMIVEMLIDIRIFLFIFFIAILAFSNCFYVFDMFTRMKQKEQVGDEKDETIAGGSYIEAVTYVYLQSLGELGIDSYNSSYAPYIYWIFFFASSLFL